MRRRDHSGYEVDVVCVQMIANLRDVLHDAARNHYAVAGVVCLGWEDMRGYARAAEAERRPLILQAGPGCRKHTPLPILGAMMCHVADSVSVPVVVHLDHSRSIDECRAALAAGFTGLMFDGSHLPLLDNIAQTRAVVEWMALRPHEGSKKCCRLENSRQGS